MTVYLAMVYDLRFTTYKASYRKKWFTTYRLFEKERKKKNQKLISWRDTFMLISSGNDFAWSIVSQL